MKTVGGNNSVAGISPFVESIGKTSSNPANAAIDKALFKDALKGLQNQVSPAAAKAVSAAPVAGLKFSNHAVERMQNRGISYSQEQLGKIESAVQKAAAKGAKESLLLTDDSALIVSVANNTVVTVMDKQSLKDNVFTNIDSTVVI